MGHQPLVIIDGAHNPAGADVCSQVFFDDFAIVGRRILVVGALKGRDPQEMLLALQANEFDMIVCCTAPSPRAIDGSVLASTALALGCSDIETCQTVEEACDRARSLAGEDDAVLIAGSLYVVGSARSHLRRIL
jgi:folylpolyglutamate synthase/dihydropteroate synthase